MTATHTGKATTTTPAAALREGAMEDWLRSADVVDASGWVWSWRNEGHEGFAYPEAAALWLSWAAWRREAGVPAGEPAGNVASRLLSELGQAGAVGRGERIYLFDTCVALDALARFLGVDHTPSEVVDRVLDGIDRFLDADSPVLPGVDGEPRWSESWGPHLVRAAALLLRGARVLGRGDALERARRIRDRSGSGGTAGGRAYLHARTYAAEGELLARALGEDDGAHDPRETARQLARVQRDDGGLPAWSDGSGASRSDVTAQAVRLWSAVDPGEFATHRRRGLGYLARSQAPGGGVLYEADGGDQNTWATLFTAQAAAWARSGPDVRGLI